MSAPCPLLETGGAELILSQQLCLQRVLPLFLCPHISISVTEPLIVKGPGCSTLSLCWLALPGDVVPVLGGDRPPLPQRGHTVLLFCLLGARAGSVPQDWVQALNTRWQLD